MNLDSDRDRVLRSTIESRCYSIYRDGIIILAFRRERRSDDALMTCLRFFLREPRSSYYRVP